MRTDKVVTEVLGHENILTPSDLYNKRFKRSLLLGYDTLEVNAFLERVADTLEGLIVQVRTLKERRDDLEQRLEEYRQMEATLRSALISSQKFGDDIIETAKREAQAIIEQARLLRMQAELESAKIPEALARDIQALERQRARLRQELLSILQAHSQLLEDSMPPSTVAGPSVAFETAQLEQSAAPASSPIPPSTEIAETSGSPAAELATQRENIPPPAHDLESDLIPTPEVELDLTDGEPAAAAPGKDNGT
ncbi:MAG: DivIVA domain-containing protein [Candidatus Hydrogenedentes bacterium]|nr:DivIVA domain-containing protein [Candidatus Hydrogenedentota bacterium]